MSVFGCAISLGVWNISKIKSHASMVVSTKMFEKQCCETLHMTRIVSNAQRPTTLQTQQQQQQEEEHGLKIALLWGLLANQQLQLNQQMQINQQLQLSHPWNLLPAGVFQQASATTSGNDPMSIAAAAATTIPGTQATLKMPSSNSGPPFTNPGTNPFAVTPLETTSSEIEAPYARMTIMQLDKAKATWAAKTLTISCLVESPNKKAKRWDTRHVVGSVKWWVQK